MRAGLASGPCPLGRGEAGRLHGAASGPGVLAAVLTKMEVTTRLARSSGRMGALGHGGNAQRDSRNQDRGARHG
jgi:hypothetical protein